MSTLGVYTAAPINQTNAEKQSKLGAQALSGQLQSGQCVFNRFMPHSSLLEAANKLVDLFQWTSGENTLKPTAAICHGAVVVMIKHQSSALLSFPNYQFHLLHYITFVEQEVMIHLGDRQVIFFPVPSHSPFHSLVSVSVCRSLSFFFSSLQPPPSSSSVLQFWYSFSQGCPRR